MRPEDSPQPAAAPLAVLLFEDEPDVAALLKRAIEAGGPFQVAVAPMPATPAATLRALPAPLVFTDLLMPGADGFDVICEAQALPEPPLVIVVSAHATLDNAVAAVKAGAFDFLAKPFSLEAVELVLAKSQRELEARARQAALCRQLERQDGGLAALIGASPALRRLRDWVAQVRGVKANVLIEGESGTGKELVARALHGGQGPFVALNMAAIPDDMAEAELFGYLKGAFTGAVRDHPGLLCQAQGGCLFMDEVNAISPALQAKLLRVLQERRCRPLGGLRERELDFRLIGASNVPLESLVETGGFRRDLYHRLKVLHVRVPPLRERPEDIPELALHFTARYASAHGRRVRGIAPDAEAALRRADWPGNVRELENVIEQAVILCPPETAWLPLRSLPPELGGEGWMAGAAGDGGVTRSSTLAEMERHYIAAALRHADGNKAQAARLLGIGYKTLLRKLAD